MDRPLAIVLSILVLEMLLQSTFTRLYFQIGFPIFRRTIKCRIGGRPIPTPDEIELSMPDSKFQPLCFRSLDASNLAFRERFGGSFQMTYTPLMHGLLSFDRRRGAISVTGYANWLTLVFIFFFIRGIAQARDALLLSVAFIAIFGVIYIIQAKRFSGVAQVAANYVSSNS